MEWYIGLAWGIFGGVASEVLVWQKTILDSPNQTVVLLKTLRYWVITLFRVAVGGGLVVAYIGANNPMTPLLAIHIGASAPLIMAGFTSRTPPAAPGQSD